MGAGLGASSPIGHRMTRPLSGSWLEQGRVNNNVLVIWPIGPMMATQPERVLLK